MGRGEVNQAEFNQALTHIETTTNPYAGEKVKATLSYPKSYKPNSVEEQVKILLARYNWLDASHVNDLFESWGKYAQADGLYVIPKPTSLAVRLGIAEPWDNFGLLTEQGPLAALASQRKFTNYRAEELGPGRYRLTESAKSALQKLDADQSGDLLVFPAQTGKLFAGFSPRNARWDIEHATNPVQWPLPAYVVGWMVYCNRHRLERYEDLLIDCPGDEYRFESDRGFSIVLYFNFDGEELFCNDGWSGNPSYNAGAASGFCQ